MGQRGEERKKRKDEKEQEKKRKKEERECERRGEKERGNWLMGEREW